MKKQKFNKKLSLNKETISNLNRNEMNDLKGGEGHAATRTCVEHCLSRVPRHCPLTIGYTELSMCECPTL